MWRRPLCPQGVFLVVCTVTYFHILNSNKKKKKKAARCKANKVTVVAVKDETKGVPKGKYRTELKREKCIEKLEFTRNMSALQVRNVVTRGFQHIPLMSFNYLTCGESGQSLILASEQEQDGSIVVSDAQSRKGIMYIGECTDVSIFVYKYVQFAFSL